MIKITQKAPQSLRGLFLKLIIMTNPYHLIKCGFRDTEKTLLRSKIRLMDNDRGGIAKK